MRRGHGPAPATPAGPTDRLWNAATCLRLLRPLKGHIVTLERAKRQEQQQQQQQAAREPAAAGPSSASSEYGGGSRATIFGSHQGRGRTYSARRRSPPTLGGGGGGGHGVSSGGNMGLGAPGSDSSQVLPTPYRSASGVAQAAQGSSRAAPLVPGAGAAAHGPRGGNTLQAKFRRISHACRSVRTANVGVDSLRLVMARWYGEFIEEEEAQHRACKPHNDSDISAERYAEIERLPLSEQDISIVLQQTVRSHAIALVCRAARCDLIDFLHLQITLMDCNLTGSSDGKASIVLAYVNSAPMADGIKVRIDDQAAYETSTRLESLPFLSSITSGLEGPILAGLEAALRCGTLSAHALFSPDVQFGRLIALRAVTSRNGEHALGQRLSKTMLVVACGLDPQTGELLSARECTSHSSGPDQGLLQKLDRGVTMAAERILVGLVSTSLMGPRRHSGTSPATDIPFDALWAVRETADDIMRAISTRSTLKMAQRRRFGKVMSMVLLAEVISILKEEAMSDGLRQIQRRLALISKLLESQDQDEDATNTSILSSLILEIARACRGTKIGNQSFLEFFTRRILKASKEADTYVLIRSAASRAIVSFLDQRPSRHDPATIKALEASLNERPLEAMEQRQSDAFLKWDSDLGEFFFCQSASQAVVQPDDLSEELKPNTAKKRGLAEFNENSHEQDQHGGSGKRRRRRKLSPDRNLSDEEDELSLLSAGPLTDVTNRFRAS